MNIDAEIAKKLFGYDLTFSAPNLYSTNGSHIEGILEALRKKGFSTTISYDTVDGKPSTFCTVYKIPPGDSWDAEEESLPLALCKAALLALEGK